MHFIQEGQRWEYESCLITSSLRTKKIKKSFMKCWEYIDVGGFLKRSVIMGFIMYCSPWKQKPLNQPKVCLCFRGVVHLNLSVICQIQK